MAPSETAAHAALRLLVGSGPQGPKSRSSRRPVVMKLPLMPRLVLDRVEGQGATVVAP